jgi:SAM-dependent methyltransferase
MQKRYQEISDDSYVNSSRPRELPGIRVVVREIQRQSGFFTASSRLPNLITIRALHRIAANYFNGTLADIGCGKKPYVPLLRTLVDRHIGIDHPGSAHGFGAVDIVGTAYHTGLTSSSCDSVLCTAVLEHLEEPEQAIREAFRILKSGAHAVYGIPFIWPIHEKPRDFYRYSRYGITHLFEKSGFRIVSIHPLAGYFVTLAHFLTFGLSFLNKGVFQRLHLVDIAIRVLQDTSLLLDKHFFREEYAWAYLVVVEKPED